MVARADRRIHSARAALTASVAAVALLLPLAASAPAAADAFGPKEPPLSTRWTDEVSADNALPEYPRPQMKRADWRNLNGEWQFEPADSLEEPPVGRDLDHKILVPYPVESALSGVMESHDHMWYRRTVTVPERWSGKNVQLNFGAVDQDAVVYVNGDEVGTHSGGYTSFSVDITDALTDGENEIIVGVHDATDDANRPLGKQRKDPNPDGNDWSIFYTSATGIWQTVWMEPTADARVTRVDNTPDVEGRSVEVTVAAEGADGLTAHVSAHTAKGSKVGSASGKPGGPLTVKVPKPRLWSPDDPYLYDLKVSLRDRKGRTVDTVDSYFGMRDVGTAMVDGVRRPTLNGEFVFQMGPLDQGYWPDGIYTAPTDEALRFDIEATKKMGFNTIRKHAKVEPARWYYWADKLGMLVQQDMPSMHRGPDAGDKDHFERQLREMIDQNRASPSIIQWTPFNESWGQYDGERITDEVKEQDPSRLVVGASGWNDTGNGDAQDVHVYQGPTSAVPTSERAAYLGEFGGPAVRLPDHQWDPERGGGYDLLPDLDALNERYTSLLGRLAPQVNDQGMSAGIYTQTTDVENEVNGLLTYDREVFKVTPSVARAAHRKVYAAAAAATDGRDAGMGAWLGLANDGSGKGLAVEGRDEGARAVQTDSGAAEARQWRLVNSGDGTFALLNNDSDRVLGVADGATENGAAVRQYADDGSEFRRWKLDDSGDGLLSLVNAGSGKVLAVEGDSDADGAPIVQAEAGDGAYRQWQLAPAGEVRIQNAYSARVVDLAGGNPDDNARIEQQQVNENDRQHWRFTAAESGFVTIESGLTGKVLGIKDASDENNADVVQLTPDGSEHQQWRLEHAGDGYVHLVNRGSGKLMAVENMGVGDGPKIRQYEDVGTRDHVWRFVP